MPGSHAATTGELLFQQKGIDYKRTDLLPVVSWLVLKALPRGHGARSQDRR